MYRRAAIAGTLVALVLVVLFGPAAYATVTGQPFYVDCGRLEATRCDETWRIMAQEWDVSAPITWVEVRIPAVEHETDLIIPQGGPLCGDYTFGQWWPPLELWATLHRPFC